LDVYLNSIFIRLVMITDLTYLNNMSGGSPEIVKEMIGIFIEQANEYVRDMQLHLDNKDYLALGKLAHKAKSSISIMGMTDLAADMKTLELLTKDNNEVETYPAFVEKFIVQTNEAMIELKDIASKL
jgi:HPt (histidine-containing phosphotransfer) domain-containing protein